MSQEPDFAEGSDAQALLTVTTQDARGRFTYCGYPSLSKEELIAGKGKDQNPYGTFDPFLTFYPTLPEAIMLSIRACLKRGDGRRVEGVHLEYEKEPIVSNRFNRPKVGIVSKN